MIGTVERLEHTLDVIEVKSRAESESLGFNVEWTWASPGRFEARPERPVHY